MKKINNKNILIFIGILIFISIIITRLDNNITPVTQNENKLSFTNEYLLKECNNRVAIYKSNSEYPIEITNISIESLNDFDKQSVYVGLFAKDKDELLKILEDLNS